MEILSKKREKPIILIVDDVPKNIQLLANILHNEENCQIAAATNGKQACEIAEKILPDIILLDIMMPEMDGYETCESLKKNPSTKDIPVIFLTARSEIDDRLKGFDVGAVDYILKPFNKAELLARIRTHLRLKLYMDNIARLERELTTDAMAVTANHELNQPLSVIQGYLDMLKMLLQSNEDFPKYEKIIQNIQTSIDIIRSHLEKYRNKKSFHFEEYYSGVKMIVFEDNEQNQN